jgi:hypothetical protein
MSTDLISLALGCVALGLVTAWLVAQVRPAHRPPVLSEVIDPLRTLH